MIHNQEQQRKLFEELVKAKMPYGKFKGRFLVELPEPYLVWYKNKGFPKGKLGEQLQLMYEIKLNGLEYLIKAFIKK